MKSQLQAALEENETLRKLCASQQLEQSQQSSNNGVNEQQLKDTIAQLQEQLANLKSATEQNKAQLEEKDNEIDRLSADAEYLDGLIKVNGYTKINVCICNMMLCIFFFHLL